MDPQLAQTWCDKGVSLGQQGKHDEALSAFDKAVEIDPQNADAWYSKGLIFKLLGRTIEADAAFTRAEELGFTG